MKDNLLNNNMSNGTLELLLIHFICIFLSVNIFQTFISLDVTHKTRILIYTHNNRLSDYCGS